MKTILKNIALYTLVIGFAFGVASCNSWLDLLPADKQTTDNFWESKEEVEAVLASAYKQLRSCQDEFVYWGELRGDALDYTVSSTNNYAKIKNLEILPDNSNVRWNDLYTTIGYANSVIKYGPTVLEKDATFTQSASDAYVAEAIFIRSLCYFYLVRTYKEVPLVLEPYVDDSEEYNVPKSTEGAILNRLTSDLESWLGKCKKGYESDDPNTWMNKGRVTQWAYHALLADIYLWEEQYERCIQHCNALIISNKFSLLSGESWYRIFYPGNSDEGIFELQYDKTVDNGSLSGLYNIFYNGGTTSCAFLVNEHTLELFTQYVLTKDLRGEGVSYQTDKRIWKHAADAGIGGVADPDNEHNWIFYRYAEILLMKAEALIMSKDGSKMREGYDIIVEQIRKRAGYAEHPEYYEDEYTLLTFLMEEREREFLAEGKRWFDILRMAKRDGYKYKDYLLDVLLANVPAKHYNSYRSKLSEPDSWYLPIYKGEIINSMGVLEQNRYYANEK